MNSLQFVESSSLAIMEETPFCQIVGRKIPGSQCLEMQGQDGCFGCAATTRLCEKCKVLPVEVPAVGFCSHCLIRQLEHEKYYDANLIDKSPLVMCPIFNRRIGYEMCVASQGQGGCHNCASVFRLCEKCKENPCRFPQYGLCLKCSVEAFGEGWDEATAVVTVPIKPSPQSTVVQAIAGVPKEIAHYMPRARQLILKQKRVSAVFFLRRIRVNQAKVKMILTQLEKEGLVGPASGTTGRVVLKPNLCVRCHEKPVHVKSRGLCKTCAVGFYRNRAGKQAQTSATAFQKLPKQEKVPVTSLADRSFSIQQKIIKLLDLRRVLGKGEMSDVLDSIILDLQGWDVVEAVVKRVEAQRQE